MKKNFKTSHNIRGTRYDIEITKDVKGMPGFAPSVYKDVEVCTICVKYLRDEPPFVQFFTKPPDLEIFEVEEILSLLKRGYVESDFFPQKDKVD